MSVAVAEVYVRIGAHPVFHVSMLRKYLKDPEQRIEAESVNIEQDLTVKYRPVQILGFSERVMCNRTIKYVKVLWTDRTEREATWELEDYMRKEYPELFESGE